MAKKAAVSPIREHLKEIIILFSVPLAIVCIIIALVYVPRLFAHPTYDFVYCEGYSCEDRFSVDSNGKLIQNDDSHEYSYRSYSLSYYDTERDSTQPLQLTDAEKYTLSASSKSPEDYSLHHAGSGGGFLFWGDYQNNWSLKKGFASKPLSLNGSDIEFIGWVLRDE